MKIGVLVNSLEINQPGYCIIDELNKVYTLNTYIDPFIFYKEYGRNIIQPHFSMMQDVQACNFNGPLISIDIQTTLRLLSCYMTDKKFFYVWDLEWIFLNDFNYFELQNIYQNDSIELICRSKYHYDIIKKCWKEPIDIIEDFNYEKIIKTVTN